jgi:hypothetical protein
LGFDITKAELEEVIAEVDRVITDNKVFPETLAEAYLKKASVYKNWKDMRKAKNLYKKPCPCVPTWPRQSYSWGIYIVKKKNMMKQ